MKPKLTTEDREDISEILQRRANEVGSFLDKYRSNEDHFGSVELALSREIARLRKLSDKVQPYEDRD
jgi:hypothetical protein